VYQGYDEDAAVA